MKAPKVSEGNWIHVPGVGVASRRIELPYPLIDIAVTIGNAEEEANGKLMTASKEGFEALNQAVIVMEALKGSSTVAAGVIERGKKSLKAAGYTEEEATVCQ